MYTVQIGTKITSRQFHPITPWTVRLINNPPVPKKDMFMSIEYYSDGSPTKGLWGEIGAMLIQSAEDDHEEDHDIDSEAKILGESD